MCHAKVLKSCFIVCGLFVFQQSSAIPPPIKPFEATYTVKYRGISAVRGTRILRIDKSGRYQFSTKLHSVIPFVSFNIFEGSKGEWTSSGPRPNEYIYRRKGLKQNRDLISHFDWRNRVNSTRKDKHHYRINIPKDAHDKLSYQLALRQDLVGGKKKLVYRLADKNHVATYIFKKTSEEVLKTHTGKIRTVRMQRVNGNPKHGTIIFWLAPKYDYLPVKVIGIENGKISAEVNLKSYRLL